MSRLETVTNVAIIIAAAVVIGDNVYGRFASHAPSSEPALSHQLVGKPLVTPVGVPVGRQGTLAVFLSKDCHYCQESMDFYRQLASAISADNACDVKLIALGPRNREKREDIVDFLVDRKLHVDGVDVVDFASLGVTGTPTLILRDSSQLVKNVWVGLLSGTRQREVLARVKLLCRN